MSKWIYHFGAGAAEGNMALKNILGGKVLAEMSSLGLPVPAAVLQSQQMFAIIIFTKILNWPEGLQEDLEQAIVALEEKSGKSFGSTTNPLLVSVRSGAPVSMPGMMDTILNLGLNDDTTKALAELTGNENLAYDAYRRFIKMFGDVVLKFLRKIFQR